MGKRKKSRSYFSFPFEISRAFLRGEPDVVHLVVCGKCGALVGNILRHEKWHLDSKKGSS